MRVKTAAGPGRILAVLTYEDDGELSGRRAGRHAEPFEVAVTGAPPGTQVSDWPVRWADGMRVLDGRGRTVVVPGEGVLVGLVPGEPLWFVDGGRVDRAFMGRGPIVVTNEDRVAPAMPDTRQTTRPHAGSRRHPR